MGKQQTLTAEHIERALRQTGGFISHAAEKLGCSQSNVSQWIQRNKKLRKVIDEITEARLDLSESKLMENVNKGKEASIFFHLKCKGKHRGYIERVEQHIEVENKKPLEIKGLDLSKLD